MTRLWTYFLSTIGKKQIMALAGIGLCVFVLGHAAGNMLMFQSPESYNKYGHTIVTNSFIYIIEVGLLSIFVIHILAASVLTALNCCARDTRYAQAATGPKATSKTTRTMMLQGVVVLAFVVLHLLTFKYGPHYEVEYGGVVIRDLFRLVFEVFQDPVYVGWYIFAVAVLGFHLSHGLYSSIQTLGLNHPKYTPKIKCISIFYGVLVAGLYISQPVYMHFFYKG